MSCKKRRRVLFPNKQTELSKERDGMTKICLEQLTPFSWMELQEIELLIMHGVQVLGGLGSKGTPVQSIIIINTFVMAHKVMLF